MKTSHFTRALLAGALLTTSIITWNACTAQEGDTPLLPDGKWHVHDMKRPQPPVVTPGEADGAIVPPPSDAIVLFDGKDLSHWQNDKWKVEDGAMTVNGGDNQTKDSFGDMQLHIEWSEPDDVKGDSQGRGNSGIFLMGHYELQVLDSYQHPSYADGEAGAVYGQTPPLANAMRPPGKWQVYDVIWTAPRFKEDKTLESPAYITVLHNGVVVQNHTALIGATVHKQLAKYEWHEATGPIRLQDHGNPVHFRNIWVRPLPAPVTVP